MTPHALLGAAETLLTRGHRTMARCWPRVCAAFLRIALERALTQYWRSTGRPDTAHASLRVQLLVLPVAGQQGAEAAPAARRAWYGLCRAVHHHSYELPPTAGELRGWHKDVALVVEQLGR